MNRIAVFYHGLFYLDQDFLPNAFNISQAQMGMMEASGLTDTADEIYCGINGSEESEPFAETIFPEKAVKIYHGLQCKTEIRTMMEMQRIMAGRKGWKVLYFHCKGGTRDAADKMTANWRNCMMSHLVANWLVCCNSLNAGIEACGCHWLTGQVNGKMALFGGNFLWVTSDFLSTLPPIENNPRIAIMGGVDNVQSRFEAEILIGEGPRLPRIRDFHPTHPFNCRMKESR